MSEADYREKSPLSTRGQTIETREGWINIKDSNKQHMELLKL